MTTVRVTLMNGQWIDIAIADPIPAFARSIKADGALYSAGGVVPWHSIASIMDKALVDKQSMTLSGMTEGKPN